LLTFIGWPPQQQLLLLLLLLLLLPAAAPEDSRTLSQPQADSSLCCVSKC
jgi:hypothetical protein